MRLFRQLLVLSRESYVLLKRDRVFVPAIVMGLVVAAFAALASQWSVEDFKKICFDVGLFGDQLTGSLVALVWGTKAVADSRQEGSLEVQLAAPVARPVWLLGKFIGLASCLVLLCVVLVVIWQIMMLAVGYGQMTLIQLAAFALMAFGWIALAALAMLFASMARQGVALFGTLGGWLAGLCAAPIAGALGSDAPQLTRVVVGQIARYWNFQRFNLADQVLDQAPSLAELGFRFAYGGLLILVLLTLASVVFGQRDVVA